jgi:hypothetical protein
MLRRQLSKKKKKSKSKEDKETIEKTKKEKNSGKDGKHEHVFTKTSVDDTGMISKVCSCGYMVTEEEI